MSQEGPKMNEEQRLLIKLYLRSHQDFHAYPYNIAKCLNRRTYTMKDLSWVKPTMSSSVLVQREGFVQAMKEVWGPEFLSLLLEMEET